jgi:hypothetical protein
MFVTKGYVEVIASFEGNDFSVEYLGIGSIINQNNFLFDHACSVTYLCVENTWTLELD